MKKGKLLVFSAPSGSGKTTFLNIAGLLETYTSGSYVLDGVDVWVVELVTENETVVVTVDALTGDVLDLSAE